MSGEKAGEKRLDETIEETFPASDPPTHTPVEGTRKAERARDAQQDATREDEKTKKLDPHGKAPSGAASSALPKGPPTSDRHDTETASDDHRQRGG